MSKIHTRYVCQTCAYVSPRWIGKCPNCNAWNTLVEEVSEKATSRKSFSGTKITALPLNEIGNDDNKRIETSLKELDRVLGGGIVQGSVVLIGGDPGIGKSTLMMQLASLLKEQIVLYICGEESAKQIKMRAERLGFGELKNFLFLAETNLNIISEIIERTEPDVLIVDSIQTMYIPEMESSPGSIGQVREATALFTKIAKTRSIPVFLVGHITKDGYIAGPKVIEHMVDTVLQFEGEQHHAYRILRAIKNRFGSTNEIGIFEMLDTGLREVINPSEVLLSERTFGSSGSTVVASIEGTRPLLIEVQALVTSTNYGVPQRNTTGVDYRRLALLLAVLDKRVGVQLGQYDVFVNIAGGIRIEEPAVDLGIAISIVSSLRDCPVDSQTIVVGEIGLGGEVRTVNQIEKRIQEASKLGFTKIIVPKNNLKVVKKIGDISIIGVERIEEAVELALH